MVDFSWGGPDVCLEEGEEGWPGGLGKGRVSGVVDGEAPGGGGVVGELVLEGFQAGRERGGGGHLSGWWGGGWFLVMRVDVRRGFRRLGGRLRTRA